MNVEKRTLCFPSRCFTWHSWEQLVGNMDASVKEIIYVTAVPDRMRQWGLFVTVVPPGSLEVVKSLPGSSEHFLTWQLGPVSVHEVNVQPQAGAKDTDMSKIPVPLLSRGKQILRRDKYTGRLFQLCGENSGGVGTDTQYLYGKQDLKDALPCGSVVKSSPTKAGDMSSIPSLGRSYMPWGNLACVPLTEHGL